MANPSRRIKEIATALVSAAHEDGVVGVVMEDLKHVVSGLQSEPQPLQRLNDRALPIDDRRAVLEKILKGHTHDFVRNALLLMQSDGLLDELDALMMATQRAAATIANHHDVAVRSATPLKADERKSLEKAIQQKFPGTHTIQESVDATLLGGLTITVGDWYYDASIKGKIERLTHALHART